MRGNLAAVLSAGAIWLVVSGCGASGDSQLSPASDSQEPTAQLQPASEPITWRTDGVSGLERSIGMQPTDDPLYFFVDRADEFARICMAEEGFDFEVGKPLGADGFARYQGPTEFRGETWLGGCEQWGTERASPHAYLGAAWTAAVAEALGRPEYTAAIEAYDECLIAAGYTAIPETEGMSDEQAIATIDEYVAAASECLESSGRTRAERGVMIYAGDLIATTHPALVESYVAEVLSEIGVNS